MFPGLQRVADIRIDQSPDVEIQHLKMEILLLNERLLSKQEVVTKLEEMNRWIIEQNSTLLKEREIALNVDKQCGKERENNCLECSCSVM